MLDAQEDQLLGRWFGPGTPRHPLGDSTPAESVEKTADSDPPYPRRHLALAPVTSRSSPHGQEGVLHDLVHERLIGAATRQPSDEPTRMPLVQDAQRARIALSDGGHELLVGRITNPGGTHTHIVDG